MLHQLKQAEIRALRGRSVGELGPGSVVDLRDLLRQLEEEPDVDEAICYHGAWALVHEVDGRLEDAVRHREIEIAKINSLHDIMRGESPNSVAFALQDYEEVDLAVRLEILTSVQQAWTDSEG